ncbi:hypothetical protein HOLleu_27001 [Holothuria leucospilota]|uniref:Ig-like domain-containing protein n=1 Tax=Holothuria leucospilota TaxID=206669 RepID=A0A9Q1BPW9_HOLLE|nr:hypothetical protein HOLleu_27001 [Holothuria leucospilota]
MAGECLCGKIVGFFATLFMISLGESQNLIFELEDRQFQEVIFPGDVTVAMICEITNVTTAEVEVTIDGKIVANNSGQGNCLKFVISRIDGNDNVKLTCSVRYYRGGNSLAVTENKTLILNVSNRDHSCFRNGTSVNQPYQVGDVLLLSCYCRVTEPCIWTETAEGSLQGRALTTVEEKIYNNKKISRIIVGPFNSSGINTLRYDCSHGPTTKERCSVGPAKNSATDFILSPTVRSDVPLKCEVTEVFSERPGPFGEIVSLTTVGSHNAYYSTESFHFTLSETKESTTFSSTKPTNKSLLDLKNSSKTDDIDGSTIALIIASAGVFVLLIVFALSIVLLFKARRYKKSKMTSTDDKEAEEVVTPNVKVDSHGYEGDKSDDALELYKNGDFTHCGIGVAHVVDNIDIDKTYGTEAQVPASQPLDNDLYANDGNYGNDGNDEDDDEMFQTADTSDYAVPVALMKNNMQGELAEAVALYAKVKRHVSMME